MHGLERVCCRSTCALMYWHVVSPPVSMGPPNTGAMHHPHSFSEIDQVDNYCVSENKNSFFIGYAGLLVAAGVIKAVEVHFMMVGHTHIKFDQVFSR